MKRQEMVNTVFTNIANEWNNKGKYIQKCIGMKNAFKYEYRDWMKNGARVLDVGCGTGKNILRINSEYKDCNLIGIDGSSKMIEIANSNKKKSDNNVEFINQTFESFTINLKFDLIIFNYVLHHVKDISETIEKACDMLSENGVIIITIPGKEYLKETFCYSDKNREDLLGRISKEYIEEIFKGKNKISQVSYSSSIFFMKFNSYEEYILYLKSIGSYQKIMNYTSKKWPRELEWLVFNSFNNSKYITGHYEKYVYKKM